MYICMYIYGNDKLDENYLKSLGFIMAGLKSSKNSEEFIHQCATRNIKHRLVISIN